MEGRGEAYQLFVGVDIAADTFTAAWLPTGSPSSAPFTGDRTPPGFAALQRRLQATGVPPATTLVVLEATDNYWVALAVTLHEAGYRVAIVNPRQAHLCWPFTPSGVTSWHSVDRTGRKSGRMELTASTGCRLRERLVRSVAGKTLAAGALSSEETSGEGQPGWIYSQHSGYIIQLPIPAKPTPNTPCAR